jgi:hypothetical protein
VIFSARDFERKIQMKTPPIQAFFYPPAPDSSNRLFERDLTLIDTILRHRDRFLAEIGQGIDTGQKIRMMLVVSSVYMAGYGALLGSTHGVWQTLSSAVKLPLLFLATLMICAPALYIINVLFGLNQSLKQSLTLVLTAITTTAILLLSFAPITLFFILTLIDQYQFFKLLNVLFFTIAAIVGASFLKQGISVMSQPGQAESGRHGLAFFLWAVVYVFVGSQMAWTLRPFVGYPNAPFELFRQGGGNFYADILASIGEILGFLIVR